MIDAEPNWLVAGCQFEWCDPKATLSERDVGIGKQNRIGGNGRDHERTDVRIGIVDSQRDRSGGNIFLVYFDWRCL